MVHAASYPSRHAGGSIEKLSGHVELDETFTSSVSGTFANMKDHEEKKARVRRLRILIIMGLLTCGFDTMTSRHDRTIAVMAQRKCGGIEGRVTTPEGWVIPMAKIRLSNRDTKQSTNVETKEDGEYAACLSPGTYDVIVITPGFKTSKRKAIKIENGVRSIIDFPLKRGGARTSH